MTTVTAEGVPQGAFDSIEAVFLGAGPTEAPCPAWDYLSDGLYYFQVTDPTGLELLSTDSVAERAVMVRGGVLSSYEGTTHATGEVSACGSRAVS